MTSLPNQPELSVLPRTPSCKKYLHWFCLAMLLLLVVLRFTIWETAREGGQTQQGLGFSAGENSPGPEVTIALSVLTLFFGGLGLLFSADNKALPRWAMGSGGVILVILLGSAISTFYAANKFVAVVGCADLAQVLIAAWAIAVLARQKLEYQLVLTVLCGILGVWLFKGGYQYFVEFPDTLAYYQQHKAEIHAQHHWEPGNPSITLFESRMKSSEITGFTYLSNVLATGVCGFLLLLTGILWLLHLSALHTEKNESSPSSIHSEIPLVWALLALWYLLTIATIFLLLGTHSRGGIALGLVSIFLLILGFILTRYTRLSRQIIVRVVSLVIFGGLGFILFYGLTHHALPSKSLLFRWQYWVGSMPIIQEHPWWGVGLNNFGDYYLTHKLPASPEAVKDPHNFLVRFATELGLPTLLFILGLITTLIYRTALLVPKPTTDVTPVDSPSWEKMFLGITSSIILAIALLFRVFLTESPFEVYSWLLASLSILVGAAFSWLAVGTWWQLESTLPHSLVRSVLSVALLVGALAMLGYDLINMALVTGPIAFLFWLFLFLSQPEESESSPRLQSSCLRVFVGALLLLMSLGFSVFTWGGGGLKNTTATGWGLGRWDSRGWENLAAGSTQNSSPPSTQDALKAIDEALLRDPRSVQLWRWHLHLKQSLGQSMVADIEKILDLNRSEARVWMDMGLLESDLPFAKRYAVLEHALWLDDQLPADELMRLSPEDRDFIKQRMRQLAP